MKLFARCVSLLAILLFTCGEAIDAQEKNGNKDLPNFYTVNSKLYRGGQPTEAGVKHLAQLGVKTIVDLRGADENSKAEEFWARAAGIKFVAVNLENWLRPKNADIERVIGYLDQSADQPVFVHCRRGADRTGTVIAVYRITHDGWTANQAIDEAKKFGFGWWQIWMKDYINDYYRDYQKQSK